MSFAWPRVSTRIKGLFTGMRYRVCMANDPPLGFAGLKTAILNWLMPPSGVDTKTAAALPSAKHATPGTGIPAEPDRADLGPGRGRTLYIRA
jgi:hypothetical protein